MIGGFTFIGGLLISLTIILSSAIYSTSVTSWSGRKLWYVIFGAKQYGDEAVDALFLGIPFVIGIIMTLIGLYILGNEYYKLYKKDGI